MNGACDTTSRDGDDPFQGRLSVRLTGRFERGGTIEFFWAGEPIGFHALARTQWAALALLALATHQSAAPFESFLSSQRLAQKLAERHVIDLADAQIAVRIVHRLRRQLGKFAVAEKLVAAGVIPEADGFASLLIARWPVLGYRLALSPALVELLTPEGRSAGAS